MPGGAPVRGAVLSGTGYVVTGEKYIAIGVRVAGRIERYYVDEGEEVRTGDPLVALDDRDYRARLERAEAGAAERARHPHACTRPSFAARAISSRRGVVAQQELDERVSRSTSTAR